MADEDHVTDLWKKPDHGQEEGCVSGHEYKYWKPDHPNCAYRVKGRAEIAASPAKMQLYLKKPEWAFSGQNYTVAREPFPHQYHHIMPSGVILGELENEELTILQASRYNINEGINLIILPVREKHAKEPMLPVHSGSHPKYNDDCKKMISLLRFDMDALTEDGKHDITEANVKGFRDNLRTWEQSQFWLLVGYGKSSMAKGVTPHINSSGLV